MFARFEQFDESKNLAEAAKVMGIMVRIMYSRNWNRSKRRAATLLFLAGYYRWLMLSYKEFVDIKATKESCLTLKNTFGKHFFALCAELPLRYLRTPTRFLLGEHEEAILKNTNDAKLTAGNGKDQLVKVVHTLQVMSQYAQHCRSKHGRSPSQEYRRAMMAGWRAWMRLCFHMNMLVHLGT